MHRTEQYWGTLILAVFFVGGAIVFTQPGFLLASTALLAWALATEVLLRQQVTVVTDSISITHSLSQSAVRPDQKFTTTTTVTLSNPLRIPVTVRPGYPPQTLGPSTDKTGTLHPGDTELSLEADCRLPFAGTYTIGPSTVTVTGPFGLFETTHTTSATATITVEPQDPNNLHVGQSGDQFAVTFGDHGTGDTGPGMVPEGMRAYTPGDPVSRINWKATARLDDVYVREFEIETIRPVAILFDGRHTPFRSARENPNEYRRHVAAALVADAATHGDPVGLYHITEDGVKASQRLSASPEQYLQLRERLYTAADTSPDTTTGTKSSDQPFTPPGNTGRIGERLQQDQSAFGTKLTPFLTDTTSRVQRIDGDSLTETARTYLKRQQQDLRVAILTDDQRQAEVYETAKLAGQLSPEVLVFLTPTVLFEANDIAAIDDIYTRYAAFERYRKRLNQLENVTAYEITPGDKLQEVLDHGAIAKQ